LKNYKYKSGEYSVCDKILTPFWNWCVELLPLWLAPNLVTLIGFGLMILGTLQLLV
jgi:ethanolaminephosphotransferase